MNAQLTTDQTTTAPATTDRRRSKAFRIKMAIILVLAVFGSTAAVKAASAGSWVYYDNDKVGKKSYTLALTGDINWHYHSDNSNNRYITWSLRAAQADRTYAAHCIGIKLILATETRQSTVGGAVSAGWSLGPSANVEASYSQTRLSGSTSDGFSWKCPGRTRNYVAQTAAGSRHVHPTLEGKLTHVGVVACLAVTPTNPNQRWCTQWDVNQFGGA